MGTKEKYTPDVNIELTNVGCSTCRLSYFELYTFPLLGNYIEHISDKCKMETNKYRDVPDVG